MPKHHTPEETGTAISGAYTGQEIDLEQVAMVLPGTMTCYTTVRPNHETDMAYFSVRRATSARISTIEIF